MLPTSLVRAVRALGFSSTLICSGCGLIVPEKSLLKEDQSPPPPHTKAVSARGDYESILIDHIACEIALGIRAADDRFKLPWLAHWGTAVTLTVSAQEQGSFNPSFLFGGPLENQINTFSRGGSVTSMQSYSNTFGIGASTSTLRSETIQYTYRNSDILIHYGEGTDCSSYRTGIQVDGDLKISQFIFDKAYVAFNGNANLAQPPGATWALYNTLTEELSFNSSYSLSANPIIKFSTIGVDPTGTALAGARSYNNDLVITIAKLDAKKPGIYTPVQLDAAGQNQHNTKVQANAISTSLKQPQ